MNDRRFSIAGRVAAVGFAFKGLATMYRDEPNAAIHTVITLVVFTAGLWLGLNRYDWAIVFLAGGALWSAEAFNTAIERLADAVTLDHHPLIGKAKDVASAAVLLAGMGALIAVLFVFVPHLSALR